MSDYSLMILERDYLLRNENGELSESREELFQRVAHSIAQVDTLYGSKDYSETEKSFYTIMEQSDFLPNSPTLRNAGTPEGQLSACFVIPIEDSMDSIFKALGEAAIIQKSGGGTGFSFSKLRPNGDTIAVNKGVTSGPISFIRVFNASTNTIKQGGFRRGANIAILNVNHPDIEEFITCKYEEGGLSNFNISVGITNEFINAVKTDSDIELINPRTGEAVSKTSANKLFNLIVETAHKNGEPGLLYLDNIEKDNPFHETEEICATNPCGEQPLLGYESCNLGSINLSNMCVQKSKDDSYEIDWGKLQNTISIAVHFLDNVIDANHYPLKVIEEKTISTRKIGLGIMGWADTLIKLKVPYNSEQALVLASEVMKFIKENADKASIQLAQNRGVYPLAEHYDKQGKRNATTTTIAPTGTISIIANCSSGIEPLFSLAYTKHLADGKDMIIINEMLLSVLKEHNLDTPEILDIIKEKGSIAEIEEIPNSIKSIFVSTFEIPVNYHVKMQAAFQKFVDNAVSKTINMKKESTYEDVRDIFLSAHELGCKGITIYRDGSRETQVLDIGIKDQYKYKGIEPKKRPTDLSGKTIKKISGCGSLYVTINELDNKLFEIFTNIGKGGCNSQSQAIARLISIALRSDMDPEIIIEQLEEIKCPTAYLKTSGDIKSCPDAIAKVMREELGLSPEKLNTCPKCGNRIVHYNGCKGCPICGGASNCQ